MVFGSAPYVKTIWPFYILKRTLSRLNDRDRDAERNRRIGQVGRERDRIQQERIFAQKHRLDELRYVEHGNERPGRIEFGARKHAGHGRKTHQHDGRGQVALLSMAGDMHPENIHSMTR